MLPTNNFFCQTQIFLILRKMDEEPNKNAEVDNPPSLESDDAEPEEVNFVSESVAGVPSSSRPLGDSAATPSNT